MAAWESPTTFAHSWARSVSEHPAATFLIFEGPDRQVSSWTYAEFDEAVQRVAAFLHSQGVGSGSAVHLALTNSPTFVAV